MPVHVLADGTVLSAEIDGHGVTGDFNDVMATAPEFRARLNRTEVRVTTRSEARSKRAISEIVSSCGPP